MRTTHTVAAMSLFDAPTIDATEPRVVDLDELVRELRTLPAWRQRANDAADAIEDLRARLRERPRQRAERTPT